MAGIQFFRGSPDPRMASLGQGIQNFGTSVGQGMQDQKAMALHAAKAEEDKRRWEAEMGMQQQRLGFERDKNEQAGQPTLKDFFSMGAQLPPEGRELMAQRMRLQGMGENIVTAFLTMQEDPDKGTMIETAQGFANVPTGSTEANRITMAPQTQSNPLGGRPLPAPTPSFGQGDKSMTGAEVPSEIKPTLAPAKSEGVMPWSAAKDSGPKTIMIDGFPGIYNEETQQIEKAPLSPEFEDQLDKAGITELGTETDENGFIIRRYKLRDGTPKSEKVLGPDEQPLRVVKGMTKRDIANTLQKLSESLWMNMQRSDAEIAALMNVFIKTAKPEDQAELYAMADSFIVQRREGRANPELLANFPALGTVPPNPAEEKGFWGKTLDYGAEKIFGGKEEPAKTTKPRTEVDDANDFINKYKGGR